MRQQAFQGRLAEVPDPECPWCDDTGELKSIWCPWPRIGTGSIVHKSRLVSGNSLVVGNTQRRPSVNPVVCDCARERDVAAKLDRLTRYADIPPMFADAAFGEFDGPPLMLIQWAAGEPVTPWVVLAGAVGVGKTRLACAAINSRHRAIADGRSDAPPVRFVNAAALIARLQAGFHDGSTDRVMAEAMDAPALVLDDLGAQYTRKRDAQAWATTQLYLLVDHRYSRQMHTIVTTNSALDDGFFADRIGSRIADEGSGSSIIIRVNYPSYRRRSDS